MIYADVRKGDWGFLWFSGKHMLRGKILNTHKRGQVSFVKNDLRSPVKFYIDVAVNQNQTGSSFFKHRLFGIIREGVFHYIDNEINGKEYYDLP